MPMYKLGPFDPLQYVLTVSFLISFLALLKIFLVEYIKEREIEKKQEQKKKEDCISVEAGRVGNLPTLMGFN